jgi:replicative DNA helicase
VAEATGGTVIKLFESDLRPMQYWNMRANEQLDKWERNEWTGYSWGFEQMDWYGKLEPNDFILISARPSMGKTALAMQAVRNICPQLGRDEVVAVFSAEMSGESLVVRLAAEMSGVNSHLLRLGKGKPEEARAMREALRSLKGLPIWIDDNSGPTTDQMLEQLSRLNETMPVKAMMFDFIELGGDKNKVEELRISGIGKNLKAIAKTLHIPVIGLSQLSRDVEKRANKRPVLSDLRYSGMLEQIADKIVFIMRPEYYLERGMTCECDSGDEKGIALVDFAKNRNGPVGTVRLGYNKQYVRFEHLVRVPIMKEGWE